MNTNVCDQLKMQDMNDAIANLLDNIPFIDSCFNIHKKIGHGTFSSVYLGTLKSSKKDKSQVAIKHIIPTSHPSRIYMELKCLKLMNGQANVIKLTQCIRHFNHFVFVMPYISHDYFQDFVGALSTKELQNYLYNLFLALERVHSFNIIHRDIKPANFLVNIKHQQYALVDFGLAQEVNQPSVTQSLSVIKNQEKLQETPQNSSSRRVKRKLADFAPSSSPYESAKKIVNPRTLLSPSKNKFCFEAVRRSPRKLSKLDSQKENLPMTTPTTQRSIVHDSPSKHTRLAEAMRLTSINPVNGARNSNSSFQSNVTPVGGASVTEISTFSNQDYGFRRRSSTLQEVKNKNGRSILRPSSCSCYGHPRVCKTCLGRSSERASRAGTPGFRAPEVLLGHRHQTTAVDMWASGVILLSLLSGRYPFFRCVDDFTSLAEICTVLGSQAVKKASARLEKLLTTSESMPPLDFMKLCNKLRSIKSTSPGMSAPKVKCSTCHQLDLCLCPTSSSLLEERYPPSAYHLLSKLLDPCPCSRITATQALRHPFIIENF